MKYSLLIALFATHLLCAAQCNLFSPTAPAPLTHWYYLGTYPACTNQSLLDAALDAPTHDAEYTLISTALAATNPPAVLFTKDWLAAAHTTWKETAAIPSATLSATPAQFIETADGGITLYDIAPDNTRLLSVSYFTTKIIANEKTPAVIAGGSDDGVSLWHNGSHIYSSPERIRGIYQADRINVTLEKGTNTFLFKILQGHAGWGLCYWLCPRDFFHSTDRFPEGCVNAMHRLVIDMDARAVQRYSKEESFSRGTISRAFVGKYVNDIIDSGNYDDGIRFMKKLTLSLTNSPNSHSIAAYGLRTLLVKQQLNKEKKPVCGLVALENAAHWLQFCNARFGKYASTNTFRSTAEKEAGVPFFARSAQAAYTQTAAAWPGLGISIEELYNTYPPRSSLGYSLAEIATLAENIGLKALPVKIDYKTLCETVSTSMPAICFWPPANTNMSGHFISIVNASSGLVSFADTDFDTWDEYREPMKFDWRWKGVALYLCATNILDSTPALKTKWNSLHANALPLSQAELYIGGEEGEDDNVGHEEPKACTNNNVCMLEEEDGSSGDGAGNSSTSLGCSSCGSSGISIYPSYSINRNDMSMTLKVTPLAYDAGNDVYVNFTFTHRTLNEIPDRHFGHRWTLNHDLKHVLDRDRAKVSRIADTWLINTTETYSGEKITTIRDSDDPTRPITAVRDHKNRDSTFSYSDDGAYVTHITDPFGRSIYFTYSDDGNLKSIECPIGAKAFFSYDDYCRVTRIITPLGTNRFVYHDDQYGMTTGIDYIDQAGRKTEYIWTPETFTKKIFTGDVLTYKRQMIDKDNITLARMSHIYRNNTLISYKEFTPDGSTRFSANYSRGTWDSSSVLEDPQGNRIATIDSYGRLHPFNYPTEDSSEETNEEKTEDTARTEHYTNDLGFVTIYYYNDKDQLTAIEDPYNRITKYLYDQNGWLTATIFPDDTTYSNVYDEIGRVIESIGPDGTRVGTVYDDIDRPVRTIFYSQTAAPGQPAIDGHPYTETHYCAGGVKSYIDRNGNTTVYNYNNLKQVTSVTDAQGNTVSYTYDDLGQLTALIDANNNATAFEYGDFYLYGFTNKLLARLIYPTKSGEPEKIRSFAYNEVSTAYPEDEWYISISTNGPSSSEPAYFENNRTAGWYRVRSDNNLHFITDYPTTSRSWHETPPSADVTNAYDITYYWEDEKPVVAVRDTENHRITTQWQKRSDDKWHALWGIQTTVTNESGNIEIYNFDVNNRLYISNPYNNEDRTTYMAYNVLTDGNLASVKNDNSDITFIYDQLGQLTTENSTILEINNDITYSYDAVGNRTGMTCTINGTTFHQNYAYDIVDRMTNTAYGNISAEYTYSYPNGQLIKKKYANGIETDYSYDSIGRMTGLTQRNDSEIINAYTYSYNTANLIADITRNQQKMSFDYDTTYQLTKENGIYAVDAVGSAPSIDKEVDNAFSYDPAGNRLLMSHKNTAANAVQIDNYDYTPDNQLLSVKWDGAHVTLRGRVDNLYTAQFVHVKQSTATEWKNAEITCKQGEPVQWTAKDIPVSGSGTVSFDIICGTHAGKQTTNAVSYNKQTTATDQGEITYEYDLRGNRTAKYTNTILCARYFYDGANQLIGISFNDDNDHTDAGDYTYEYDAFGRRISATEDGVTRYFAYSGLDVIAELDSNADINKQYVRGRGLGGGIGDIIAIINSPLSTVKNPPYQRGTQGDVTYYSYNHRGDVVLITDFSSDTTASYEYTAFGEPIASPDTRYDRFLGFSSKEYDIKSGLSYYGFRYYDSSSARWMKKDPIGWEGGINLYGFVGNNALLYDDHYGLVCCITVRRASGRISSSKNRYGHEWIMLSSNESYGWWPKTSPTGDLISDATKSVDGWINNGNPKDPYHDELFHIEWETEFVSSKDELKEGVQQGNYCKCATCWGIETCIREYAKKYGGKWSLRNSCRTFVKRALKACCLKKAKKTIIK